MMESRTFNIIPSKGLMIIYTGNGKGKTTAAFGMLLRFLSHGMRCAVVQFIKSSPDSAKKILSSPLLTWDNFGYGFLNRTKSGQKGLECAKLGWDRALACMANPLLDLLILDELNILLAKGYLSEIEVLDRIINRRPSLHIVLTGRMALPAFIEAADLVTEMKKIKHPFSTGVLAQRGVEF